MNRQCNLTKRIQANKGLRYCPAVLSANGRIRPDLVLVENREERYPEYISWYEGKRLIRLSVGKDAIGCRRTASAQGTLSQRAQQWRVCASLGRRRASFRPSRGGVDETELTKKPQTLAALNYFTESCPELFLQGIDRTDLLKFCAFLKFENVMTFLKANGLRGLVRERLVTVHRRRTRDVPADGTRQAFQSLRRRGAALVRVLSDDRHERAGSHVHVLVRWSDVNFPASTARVSHKTDRGWTPKSCKGREIPIPVKLVKSLKARKAKSDKTCSLVFATGGCNPKLNFLDCLKAAAERAGGPDSACPHPEPRCPRRMPLRMIFKRFVFAAELWADPSIRRNPTFGGLRPQIRIVFSGAPYR